MIKKCNNFLVASNYLNACTAKGKDLPPNSNLFGQISGFESFENRNIFRESFKRLSCLLYVIIVRKLPLSGNSQFLTGHRAQQPKFYFFLTVNITSFKYLILQF